ncbi:MAG: histidinol-phosphatase [Oscillospiraceae bacterium]|nr:histidinol-phosphatase [Oscillospiraceae bacterium]
MTFRSNLHTHSTFCDGKADMEDFVKTAIDKRFVSLGFSSHGPQSFDPHCCLKKERTQEYIEKIDSLKQKYSGSIEIYAGIEKDFYGNEIDFPTDYVIGAVHYVEIEGGYYCIDRDQQELDNAVKAAGGIEQVVELYYDTIIRCVESKPDILAHIDMIKMYGGHYFSGQEKWYRQMVCTAINSMEDVITEVNTGGIYRGYINSLYPDDFILKHMAERQIPITLSSDAHQTSALDGYYDKALEIIKNAGFRSIKIMQGGGFTDQEL